MENIIIIGAGAAGLSAALELAKNGVVSILVSDMPSERAQSVMAEGGINAAADTVNDSPELHAKETYEAGKCIADIKAVSCMTKEAPHIIEELFDNGMAFTLNKDNRPDVRAFGGQSVKRTFYAAANTGKQLMYTLIDQVRSYEVKGLINRLTGWQFLRLLYDNNTSVGSNTSNKSNVSKGCVLYNPYTKEKKYLYGRLIIATGGLNGMFGNATGSVKNTGAVTANLFASGVRLANGEFIQYHPTTVRLHGKNMLISEAVRGEGGRLYVLENGEPYYFMEDKYPKRGNLMPRDVIAREEWIQMQQGKQVYLDMSHLDRSVSEKKLKGVIDDCMRFLNLDPRKEPIPVTPGIHYFMGGIWVDINHRTSMDGLYAAGECACQYHGANRLGGNSLLGAMYGGRIAAKSAIEDSNKAYKKAEAYNAGAADESVNKEGIRNDIKDNQDIMSDMHDGSAKNADGSYVENWHRMQDILKEGLGIVRSEKTLSEALSKLDELTEKVRSEDDNTAAENEKQALSDCCLLGRAMLLCALERKESRGAHNRSDYPQVSDSFNLQTIAEYIDGMINIHFQEAGE